VSEKSTRLSDQTSLFWVLVFVSITAAFVYIFMEKSAKDEKKRREKENRKRKKNAKVICKDGKTYWTTQAQFWQWVRENVVVKVGDGPLHGKFVREHEEYNVVLSNTVLNLRCPNHLSEALASRRRALQ